MLTYFTRGLYFFFYFWRLIQYVVAITLAVVAKRVVTAWNMFTLRIACLFLFLKHLTEEYLVTELTLKLVFLFSDRSFVQKAVDFLLQRLDIVLVQKFCAA